MVWGFMRILFTGLIVDDLLPEKNPTNQHPQKPHHKTAKKQRGVGGGGKGNSVIWSSHIGVLEAPDITMTDLILLSYHKYAQMFLSTRH